MTTGEDILLGCIAERQLLTISKIFTGYQEMIVKLYSIIFFRFEHNVEFVDT